MPSVPLLGGIIANEQAEFIASPPVNLEPVALDTAISKGQFRAPAGVVNIATGPGADRGGVSWNGRHLRVMGDRLVELSGAAVVDRGYVGGSGYVAFDYSFSQLAIASGEKLFYFDGLALTQVTDIDLGPVKDMIWVDGYFMTTDGNHIVVTQLSDPTAVDPLKYGSAEEDPDMIVGLLKFRGEVYALGRYTIQVFQNVGGSGFAFQGIQGATIPYGCVGPSAKCLFAESFAFVGSARGEALGVYVAGQGTAVKISDARLDAVLAGVGDASSITLENLTRKNERRLRIRLPNETWVYCFEASRAFGQPVWYIQKSGKSCRIVHPVEHGGRFICGDADSNQIGELSDSVSSHFGEPVEWRFDTSMLYNDGRGFILNAVELIGLPGRMPFSENAGAFLSITHDGETWSREMSLPMGRSGARGVRMHWRLGVMLQAFAGLRFRGFDHAMPGFAKLEVEAEPLAA